MAFLALEAFVYDSNVNKVITISDEKMFAIEFHRLQAWKSSSNWIILKSISCL